MEKGLVVKSTGALAYIKDSNGNLIESKNSW
jgi:hypothetical protein